MAAEGSKRGSRSRKRAGGGSGSSFRQKLGGLVLGVVLALCLQRALVWHGLPSAGDIVERAPAEVANDPKLRARIREMVGEEFAHAKKELAVLLDDVRAQARQLTSESVKLAQATERDVAKDVALPSVATTVSAVRNMQAVAPSAKVQPTVTAQTSTAPVQVKVAATQVKAGGGPDKITQAKLSDSLQADALKVQERRLAQIKQLDAPCEISAAQARESKADEDWCKRKQSTHGVVVQKTWGSLSGPDKSTWVVKGCDGVALHGKKLSCADKWGSAYLETWRQSAKPVCTPTQSAASQPDPSHPLQSSRIIRKDSGLGHTLHVLENVQLDFGKMRDRRGGRGGKGSRGFESGFLMASGCQEPAGAVQLQVPPSSVQLAPSGTPLACDVWEDAPTFVMGHDDIFNFGHSMSDFFTVWVAMEVLGFDWGASQLLNMDLVYGAGPAGIHGFFVPDDPDHIGPFFGIYQAWWRGRQVRKAAGFGDKRVCFKQLAFQPKPQPAHLWEIFALVEKCSLKRPSSMFLRYASFHTLAFGQLDPPPFAEAGTRVALLLRKNKIVDGKTIMTGSSRQISNPDAVLAMLKRADLGGLTGGASGKSKSGPAAHVAGYDFTGMPLREQMAIMHQSSVLVGMHGAGMSHILSLPVMSEGCCVVIEMFPIDDHFIAIQQFGNLARFVGAVYDRWESKVQTVEGVGTEVDVASLQATVEGAAKKLRERGSLMQAKHCDSS